MKGSLDFFHCLNCSLLYQPDARKERVLESEYFKGYHADHIRDLAQKEAETILAKAEKWAPEKRIFELGSGVGHFAEVAMKQGWHYTGLDIAPLAPTVVKGWAQIGDIEDETLVQTVTPKAFVVAIHVVEHFMDPQLGFRKLAERACSGGLVFLHTPNGSAAGDRKDWFHYWPEHSFIYSFHHLCGLMTQVGVVPIGLETVNNGNDMWFWGRKL